MKRPVIVACARTPIGRAHKEKGWFRDTRSDDLATLVVKAVVERSGIDPKEIDDLVLGCAFPEKEQGLNVGRAVSLMAGLPFTVSGATVNRWCGSSLQALNQASHDHRRCRGRPDRRRRRAHAAHPHGDRLRHQPRSSSRQPGRDDDGPDCREPGPGDKISRKEQDEFAMRSHRRLPRRPTPGRSRRRSCRPGAATKRARILVEKRSVRPRDTSLESLGALQAGVHARRGHGDGGQQSSPLNVGAAALLVMSEERAKELGLKPKVRSPGDGGGRRRSVGDGHRPGAGDAQGAGASRPEAGRHRPDRDQRSVRRPVAQRASSCSSATGEGQRPRRRPSPSAIRWGRRGPHRHDADSRDGATARRSSAWRRCASAPGKGSPRFSRGCRENLCERRGVSPPWKRRRFCKFTHVGLTP